MTFVWYRIHHLDFTFLHIHETIHGLAGPGEERARGIAGNSTGPCAGLRREPGPAECVCI